MLTKIRSSGIIINNIQFNTKFISCSIVITEKVNLDLGLQLIRLIC